MKSTKKTTLTENKSKKVALYLRANNVDGIVKQLFQAYTFAIDNGLCVSPTLIYSDICSGNKFPRPAFDKLISEKYSSGIDTVLVTSPDRLGRSSDVVFCTNMLLAAHKINLSVVSK
jgi:DNA invertase Pin-like site-specific DNA recombinase